MLMLMLMSDHWEWWVWLTTQFHWEEEWALTTQQLVHWEESWVIFVTENGWRLLNYSTGKNGRQFHWGRMWTSTQLHWEGVWTAPNYTTENGCWSPNNYANDTVNGCVENAQQLDCWEDAAGCQQSPDDPWLRMLGVDHDPIALRGGGPQAMQTNVKCCLWCWQEWCMVANAD